MSKRKHRKGDLYRHKFYYGDGICRSNFLLMKRVVRKDILKIDGDVYSVQDTYLHENGIQHALLRTVIDVTGLSKACMIEPVIMREIDGYEGEEDK